MASSGDPADGLIQRATRNARARHLARQLEVAAGARVKFEHDIGGLRLTTRHVGVYRWFTHDDSLGTPTAVVFVLPTTIFPRAVGVLFLLLAVYAAFFGVVAFSKWNPEQTAHGAATTSVFAVSAVLALITLFSFFQLVFSDPGVLGADNVNPVNEASLAAAATGIAPTYTGSTQEHPTASAAAAPPRASDRDREEIVDQKDRLIAAHRPMCTTCQMRRPLRASHCSVCHTCVAHHDHHCGITGSCVGRDNIGAFVRFTIGVAMSCNFIGSICGYLFFATDSMGLGKEGVTELVLFIIAVFSAFPLNYGAWYTLYLYTYWGVTLRERRRESALYSVPQEYVSHMSAVPWSEVPRPFDGGCLINLQALCGCGDWHEARRPQTKEEEAGFIPDENAY